MNMRFTTGRSEFGTIGDVEFSMGGDVNDLACRYHDENTKLEDLTHPEDIEHFKKHEEMEAEQERQEQLNKQSIIEANIPAKFRRG